MPGPAGGIPQSDMHVQQLILELQRFWAERDCVVQQPVDIEVGAGTFHPATYLRCLGPEPYRAAFSQFCRRPTDGRYGENPNRLGAYFQFQVGLKPSPLDVQEQYLASLRHIGLDPLAHDIRFVEDNWESPTLGAWGLGWEVWVDGMEVTQFTYFQQAGGIELTPITAELTYGVERLAMYLQNVDNVYDLHWNDHLSYGQVRQQDEVEYSHFHFESADVALNLELFAQYERECLRLAERQLILPAYEYCMKSSHAFNILDARGAISVTERQRYIGRVRKLARECAEGYVRGRARLGFPLLGEDRGTAAKAAFDGAIADGASLSAAARAAATAAAEATTTATIKTTAKAGGDGAQEATPHAG